MTKETMFAVRLAKYEDDNKALMAEYEWRWNNVSVNSGGEASAEETYAVNEWYAEEEARLTRELFTELKKIA